MSYTEHHFRVEIAKQYGMDAAVFLHDVFYWVQYNRSNQQNEHDGRYWMYNTMKAFCELHPYWSKRQIERIIAKCKDSGLLLTGCYNNDPRDRTAWYTLTDAGLALFDAAEIIPEGKSNAPNGEMEITETCNTSHQTGSALPDNIPDNIIPPIVPPRGRRVQGECRAAPDWAPERFHGFWKFYPKQGQKDKQKAMDMWDKLRPDDALIATIGRALIALKATDEWRRGIGIPYAHRFLRDARWEDAASLTPEPSSEGWAEDPEVI